jgi:hypothetical protein
MAEQERPNEQNQTVQEKQKKPPQSIDQGDENSGKQAPSPERGNEKEQDDTDKQRRPA